MQPAFLLKTDDCELLLGFEQAGSLPALAQLLGRDVSVLSRRLTALAREAAVLEKRKGRWALTALGRQLNRWTSDAAGAQRSVLKRQQVVKVGSTREFAARVLMPGFAELFPRDDRLSVTLRTYEQGIEPALSSGEIDFGFDCGRPQDPAIRFSIGAREPLVVCASRAFLKAHRASQVSELLSLPHVLYTRTNTQALSMLSHEVSRVPLVCNDIACARQAVVQGLGWATLPLYCLRDELARGELVALPGKPRSEESFGVWALRDNASIRPWLQRALAWLKQRKLD